MSNVSVCNPARKGYPPLFTVSWNGISVLGLAVCLLSLLASSAIAEVFPMHATAVYGQPDFTSLLAPVADNQRIGVCRGLAATEQGLYISDSSLNRVLFFPKGATTATQVYGQPNFSTFTVNSGGISASSLYNPNGIAADTGGLYVADTYNNRVLHFPHGSKVADRVYGQPDFVSANGSYSGYPDRSLYMPIDVALDPDGGLYICESNRHRVVYYPPGQSDPTFVYGQPDFTSSYAGVAPDRLYSPSGIAADQTGVYVVDSGNHRLLFFPKGSKQASRVYGQPDFYSSMPNAGKMGPGTLTKPNMCAVDEHGLYISEYLNNRVQFFPGESTRPSVVYGQHNFNTTGHNQYGVSGYGFYVASSVAADDTSVYIADHTNRVLRFAKRLTPMPADLAFGPAPTDGVAGVPWPDQPVVTVRWPDGSPAADFNGPVTLRLRPGVGPERAVLQGTVTVNAAEGVATFENIGISHPGTYEIQALALSLPVLESAPITMIPSGGMVLGDMNHDGKFDMADIARHIQIIAGLEAAS